MNKRLIYVFGLIGSFLMWGLFSFVASAPESALTLLGLGTPILLLLNAARKPALPSWSPKSHPMTLEIIAVMLFSMRKENSNA